MISRQHRATWWVAAAAGVLVAFAPVVAGVRTLSQRDTDRLYAPVRTLVVDELWQGRLPLWNPYEGTGAPLLAEGVHSVLHPISLVAALVAPASIDALALAYLVAAAVGACVLASTLGASGAASAGAGLAFALSGYSVSMTGNLVFLAGLSTLPWLVAAGRSAGAGDRWGAVATALATACAFLSGDVQAALVGAALGLALAADAGGAAGASRALVGMSAGTLLAGVQLAATRALLPLTYRGVELPELQKLQWALAPARLVEWVVPGLARGPLEGLPAGAAGPRPDALPFAESVYLGAPLVFAAVLGARRGGRRTTSLLTAAAAALLWLALGHHLGARQLLDDVPVWSRFRYPEKLMAPLALCLCALGALGIDAFAAADRLPRAASRALAAGALSAGALLIGLTAFPAAADGAASRLAGDLAPFYRANVAAGLPHLAAGLVALLAVDRLRGGAARTLALAALAPLAAAAALPSAAHLGAPDARRFVRALRLDADTPAPRIAHPVDGLYDRAANPDHVEATARADAILMRPAINVASRVDTVEPYTGFEPTRLTALSVALERGWSRGFRRFALTHVVVPLAHARADDAVAAYATAGGALVQRDPALGVEVWAVPHRPWAFFAARAVSAEPGDALRVLLDLAASGDDATVVVEAPAPPPTGPGRVLRIDRGTTAVSVEAEADGPALLVIQDAWWPGWRATVDGAPAEILATDFLVRSIPWPPGRHRLELVYDPPELRTGAALSALGAILLVVLAAAALRRGAAPVP